jgi:hypothetical protein
MALHLILGSVVVLGWIFAVGLVAAISGIKRGDRGKRLTGRPDGLSEAFARRLLTGSRGYGAPTDREQGR